MKFPKLVFILWAYDSGVMFGLRLEQMSMYQVHIRLVMSKDNPISSPRNRLETSQVHSGSSQDLVWDIHRSS